MPPRWTRRPEGSTWGDFGPDDQLGRLNLLTPEKVREAVAEIHEGLSFCLSLPLDFPGEMKLNPRRTPPRLSPTTLGGVDLAWTAPTATARPVTGYELRQSGDGTTFGPWSSTGCGICSTPMSQPTA